MRRFATSYRNDASMFLAEFNMKPDRIADIPTIPLERIVAVQGGVNRKLETLMPGMITGFSPVVDGISLLQNPFDPVAPEVSADVPMLIGFNRTELTLFAAGDPSLFSLDEADLLLLPWVSGMRRWKLDGRR